MSLAIVLCIVLALMPITVLASSLTYHLPGGGTLGYAIDPITGVSISGCGGVTELVIPSEIDGVPVTAIAGSFHDDDHLISVIIPDSVTDIVSNVFENCSNLTSVTLSNSITTIGLRAFSGCNSLTNVTISESVDTIKWFAFDGCSSLTDVYYGGSKSQWNQIDIGEYNESLTHATIHCSDGVLNPPAGSGQSTAPSAPTTPSNSATNTCGDSLTWSFSNGTLAIQGSGHMKDFTNDEEHTISQPWADYRKQINTVIIGNGVTSIGNGAFWLCENLTSVTIPDSVTSIGTTTFTGCSSLTSVTIPDGVTSIGTDTFTGCSSLTSMTIPNSVTSIGTDAFNGCSNLASVTIPDSVTAIGEGAFAWCENLIDVYYGGIESQWKKIISIHYDDDNNDDYITTHSVFYRNNDLGILTFHYNNSSPSAPSAPSTPSTPSTGAVLSPQKLAVNGNEVNCEKYNIGGSNYFKLRDLAYLLNGTGSQFGVGYDAATSTVTITTGAAYESAGGELAAGVDNSSTAKPSSQSILIDGTAHGELSVYNIGGSNFFQLRELGNVLGFEVDYDAASNTAIVRSIQK